MIRGANPGTPVIMNFGLGPKAKVIVKIDLRNLRRAWAERAVYYIVEPTETMQTWEKGDQYRVRAKSLIRDKGR